MYFTLGVFCALGYVALWDIENDSDIYHNIRFNSNKELNFVLN